MTINEIYLDPTFDLSSCINDTSKCVVSDNGNILNVSKYLDSIKSCYISGGTSKSCDITIGGENFINSYIEKNINKEISMESLGFDLGSVGFILGIVLLLLWLSTIFKFVGEKKAVVYKWFGGKYAATLNAGFNIKPPFPIYTKHKEVNLALFELKNSVGVKTSDGAFLEIPVNLQLRIIKGKEKEAVFELDNYKEQLFSYVYNAILKVANGMNMEDIFNSKDKFQNEVSLLSDLFEGFGFKVDKVLIEDPKVSSKIQDSFENVLNAKRREEAATYDANAKMIELVGEAKAKSEAMALTAKGVANARNIIAKGNANAIAVMLGKKTMEVKTKTSTKNVDGKEVTYEVEEVTYKDVENPIETNLTDRDILAFLDRINEMEAWKDASRGEGTVIITGGNNNMNTNLAQIEALIKAQTSK